MSTATSESPSARRGRRAGLGLYFALMVVFTAICSLQIIRQAWAEPPSAGPAQCDEGLVSLALAVERGRLLASAVPGERPTMEAFRRGLLPEWSSSGAVRTACRKAGGSSGEERFDEVERLRFAEERALRYEAPELADLRRRVRASTRTGPAGGESGRP